MSSTKASAKKRALNSDVSKSGKKLRVEEDDLFDPDLSRNVEIRSDLKGIMSALHQIREKSQKDGQKKNEETISSLSTEMKSMIDDLKSKLEKERQSFAKALSKSSKECENSLKIEAARFQEVYEKFSKERSAHLQAFQDSISKFEEEKERLFMRYEQQRKKEKTMISEHEKACADKIARLEDYKPLLSFGTQDDKTFNILRKTLGSFLGNGSDEDFPPDD
ncbi:hypothetical protein CK203_027196 [Vitis vinifera]|uniref:DNA ligase 1 n=1 Tax=Vitis vinifera TaxID=29760 RepID=A0A438I691_VITVI|nr:hypothetical protein CK203_027196 [Vitis vinifera]